MMTQLSPTPLASPRFHFLAVGVYTPQHWEVNKPYLISTGGRRVALRLLLFCLCQKTSGCSPSPVHVSAGRGKSPLEVVAACLPQCTSLMGKQRSRQPLFMGSPPHYWVVSHISLQRGSQTSKIKCKWTKNTACTWSSTVTLQATTVYILGLWSLALLLCQDLQKWAFLPYFKSTVNFVSKTVLGNQNEMILRLAQRQSSWNLKKRNVSDSGWLKQRIVKQTIITLKKAVLN